MIKQSYFIDEWKKQMLDILVMQYGPSLNKKKVNGYLDELIAKHLHNPKVVLANNYKNLIVPTDLLTLLNMIKDQQLIVGGAGTLFKQHDLVENVLIGFIRYIMKERSMHKKLRDQCEQGSYEELMEDILQLNAKIIINSLYGCIGYPGFFLYNRFIAESVTNQGRQIICTAVCTFEAFLSGTVKFANEEELFTFIHNIHVEYETKRKGEFTILPYMKNEDRLDGDTLKHLVNQCAFHVKESTMRHLAQILRECPKKELVYLYFKNNIEAFNQLDYVKEYWRFLFANTSELLSSDTSKLDDKVQQKFLDLLRLYETFVLYNYPVFDRVRKAMFTDHYSVLYVDTDSNFLGLAKLIEYLKTDVLKGHYMVEEADTEMIGANFATALLSVVIARAMFTLGKSMNATDEYAEELFMKNEKYYNKIVFMDVKKRYVGNEILSEGKRIFNKRGTPGKVDIKGMDFKKSTTKDFVRNFYTTLCEEDICGSKTIDVVALYKKLFTLRDEIDQSIRNGESKYLKQSNVNIVSHYKNPYSTQGITATLLWNVACPEYAIELPSDVDIVPIIDLTWPKPSPKAKRVKSFMEIKNIIWFADKYPEAFDRIRREIYLNPNPEIAHMTLKNIAKPKNNEIQIPEWLQGIMDQDKIILNTINMFVPILNSLGMKSLKVNSNTSYMSNMIDL